MHNRKKGRHEDTIKLVEIENKIKGRVVERQVKAKVSKKVLTDQPRFPHNIILSK